MVKKFTRQFDLTMSVKRKRSVYRNRAYTPCSATRHGDGKRGDDDCIFDEVVTVAYYGREDA